ncbi:MAG: MBL fold metallo-hydrolase [Chloroflexota bacterium]
MTTEIKMMTLGIVATNSYLIGDLETKEAILIDPVADAPLLKKTADDAGWTIKLILATHAHFDHVLASKELKNLTNAPFWIHEDCVSMLENLPQQGRRFGLGEFPVAATPDRLLKSESETIELGSIKLKTLYTPGHADGHLSFYMPSRKMVFSGDTLFFSSIGRTDLPGGNHERLLQSIREQLFPLGDDVTVLPGHMRQTTIGFERQNNPFL